MLWIYILECDNDMYYIGKTSRLYKRMFEHNSGNGGLNTSIFSPENIIAIYKVSSICKFMEYDYYIRNKIHNIYFNRCNTLLCNFNEDIYKNEPYFNEFDAENSITESFMMNNKKNWNKIRGGKYTRFDCNYIFPSNVNIQNLPLCNCGLPCDIKKNEDSNYLFFRCAKKNIWSEMKELFDITYMPCKFFMKYTLDVEYYKDLKEKKNKIEQLINTSPWLKKAIGIHEFCIGGCGKEYDNNNTIRYNGHALNLCFDCFINKNNELSEKYDFFNYA